VRRWGAALGIAAVLGTAGLLAAWWYLASLGVRL
jgi:hypothetical protein